MHTYHIHIGGLVQGVGFRPLVSSLAHSMGLNGWVINAPDGVHIEINASPQEAEKFYREIISHPPPNALITAQHMGPVPFSDYRGFEIRSSSSGVKPDLLLTPDIAICPACRRELTDARNRRHGYAFCTCLHCGPRYSIITDLPYDRSRTSMAHLPLCRDCGREYEDLTDRRFFSQTNSCPRCSIPMKMFNAEGEMLTEDPAYLLLLAVQALKEGHIVAVKGIGGYLLLTDARQLLSIQTLRQRKERPRKPLAVLYPKLSLASGDVVLSKAEKDTLQSPVAPVVLCRLKKNPRSGLCTEAIAPGLNKIGVLLPYTPLLLLLAEQFGAPLIATSGNLSGSPIIYTDEDALTHLTRFADYVISFDRDIVAPQDDSVVQFSPEHQQRIVLRRSRGLAPNYLPHPFKPSAPLLAMGADLKSAFALCDEKHTYISQYLGDQGSYESQQAYRHTLQHLTRLLQWQPKEILVDRHPGYHSARQGRKMAEALNIPCTSYQHHKAHFAAVLAENNLLQAEEKLLGVVWDGTGYGDDGQIWGGEFFTREEGSLKRVAHLDYFPQLLGDKMSREPRLSALALLGDPLAAREEWKELFSGSERIFYDKLLQQEPPLRCSSMGRLIDGVAALLGVSAFNSYEGEAAMALEALAEKEDSSAEAYPIPVAGNRIRWQPMIRQMMEEKKKKSPARLAHQFFLSLAKLVFDIAAREKCRHIAFSGGVFQNALLADLLLEQAPENTRLYFHRQLSPNDECIALGQLALHEIQKQGLESREEARLPEISSV